MEEFRMWRLCTIMHCRPSELENERAIDLDWLLEIDSVWKQFKAEQEKAAANG